MPSNFQFPVSIIVNMYARISNALDGSEDDPLRLDKEVGIWKNIKVMKVVQTYFTRTSERNQVRRSGKISLKNWKVKNFMDFYSKDDLKFYVCGQLYY